MGSAATLTMEDAEAISSQVSGVKIVAPFYTTSQQLVTSSANTHAQIVGTTPDYREAYNLALTEGSFFSDYDLTNGNRVAVIGSNVKDTLFGTAPALGKTMRAGNQVLQVTGVLASKGATIGTSIDDSIFIPLTSLQQMFVLSRTARGEHIVNQIALKVKDEGQSAATIAGITSLLRTRHQIGTGKDSDFSITSMADVASTVSDTASSLTFLLGAIAAISLLVGGIGVMNIMLVSVVERTGRSASGRRSAPRSGTSGASSSSRRRSSPLPAASSG